MADISKIKLPNNGEYLFKDIKALSRGEQLVTNGSGIIGDNTNFSNLVFDGAKANSSAGSFTRTGAYKVIVSDDFFPVNANEKYKFEFDMMSQSNAGTMYAMLLFYDVDKKEIVASNHMYYAASLTTLTRDLKAGDTVIYLADASGYKTYGTSGHLRALIFWDYKNSFGYLYPPETYSKNYIDGAWTDDSAIDKTNNIITLAKAYTGPTRPAGTYVSQGSSGSTYKYSGIIGSKVPVEWTHYTGYFDGTDYSGENKYSKFPPAAAYCKVGFLWNYNSADDQFWVTNISVKEVPKELAGEVILYGGDDTGLGGNTPADNAKQYYLDITKVQTFKPKVFYNHSGNEYTIVFANGSGNGNFGTILKWGYTDRYVRILRRSNGNWITTDWEKMDAGNADTATSAKQLSLNTAVTGDTVDDFRASSVNVAPIKSITIPGLGQNDGIIVWIPYSINYGRQLIFDDTTHKVFSRYLSGSTWSGWEAMAVLNKNDANAFMNALDTGSSTPVDADYYISQYVGGGTTTTTYHRRPMSALWSYIKGKIESIVLSSSTHSTSATTAATSSAVKEAYDLADTANTASVQLAEQLDQALVFNTTYEITGSTATFTAKVYNCGDDVTSDFSAACFTWWKRTSEGMTQYQTTGPTFAVNVSTLGYGATILARFNSEGGNT